MKTLNLITSLMAVAAAALLTFSCEKQEEELIVPVENNKEEVVEVVVAAVPVVVPCQVAQNHRINLPLAGLLLFGFQAFDVAFLELLEVAGTVGQMGVGSENERVVVVVCLVEREIVCFIRLDVGVKQLLPELGLETVCQGRLVASRQAVEYVAVALL